MENRTFETRRFEDISTRDNESREHENLKQYDMEYNSPLKLSEQVKKDGYNYAWVNSGINGNSFNVEEMTMKKWTLVPADRAPHLSLDPLGRNPISKQYISYKDVILMERPAIYSEQEQERLNKLNRDKLKSLSGVTDHMKGFTHTTSSTEAT